MYKVCPFPAGQKVTEVTCAVCKLSCKRNIRLLFIRVTLLQPEDLVHVDESRVTPFVSYVCNLRIVAFD